MNDPLAQIEDRAKSFHATVWLGDGGEPAGILYEVADEMADDVLALVEIAKAAREAMDCKGPYNGLVSERGGDAALCTKCGERLSAALSVLDDREET